MDDQQRSPGRKVLIGVDETTESRAAVATAFDFFGSASEYTIVCIHERRPLVISGFGVGASVAGLNARLEESVGRQLAEDAATASRSELPDDADVNFASDVGHAGSMIVQTAADSGSDVIVIGSSERSFWDRLFTPSVGKYLVDNSPCPVLVVR